MLVLGIRKKIKEELGFFLDNSDLKNVSHFFQTILVWSLQGSDFTSSLPPSQR